MSVSCAGLHVPADKMLDMLQYIPNKTVTWYCVKYNFRVYARKDVENYC